MICILAANRLEADRFAQGQSWQKDDWFYGNEETLHHFHGHYIILRLPSFFELPFAYWSKIETLARTRQH